VRRLDIKVAWSKKQKKNLQERFKERTDTIYGHVVALTEINTKKHKPNSEKELEAKKKWKCSSETHQRTTHKYCPQNPKHKELQGDSTENVTKVTCSNNNFGGR
jgi:hypothetical protein